VCPASVPEGCRRGWIIPIGGAEKKVRAPAILKRFVELCGGRDSEIVIVPTASQLREAGKNYERLFRDMGARRATSITLESRADCKREETLRMVEGASGLFMTGGNQLRLSTNIGGTPLATAIRRHNAEGMHVAGTSAGAAFLSEHMIAKGAEGATPRSDMVTLAPGLGLTNRVIIDQHFRQRDRIGRLLTALAYNPFACGLGLDEDTGAFIGPNDNIEVIGSGGLTIIDPSEMEHSTMDSVSEGKPVSLIGVKLHVLAEGGQFDLIARRARPSAAT